MEQTIINYIIKEFHGGDETLAIDAEEDLLGSGLVESMGMMRLIRFIEKTYEVKVSPQDMTIQNFMTVSAIVRYLERSKS